jgi:hypothetical protein
MELVEKGINWESAFYRQQDIIDGNRKVIQRLNNELKDARTQIFILKSKKFAEPKKEVHIAKTGKYCEACPTELTVKDVNGLCKNCR